MTRKLSAVLPIIIFSLVSIFGIAEAETSEPETSKQIKLPSPFSRWNGCDLARLLYPSYNCKNCKINDKEGGSIENVAIWREGGKTHLLALFEKFGIGNESEIIGRVVDIALYDIKNEELKLTVSAKEVISYREYGSSYFDLAPYRLNSRETAVGVRVDPGIGGSFGLEELYLLRIKGKSFQQIFARVMMDAEYDDGYKGGLSDLLRRNSILQVIPRASSMNDFKIVTRYYRFNNAGQEENEIVKTTSEIWRWNQKSHEYQLLK